jgi:hypothetical protein
MTGGVPLSHLEGTQCDMAKVVSGQLRSVKAIACAEDTSSASKSNTFDCLKCSVVSIKSKPSQTGSSNILQPVAIWPSAAVVIRG